MVSPGIGGTLRGFVPTPGHTVDAMISRLFASVSPSPDHVLIDPGCGPGAFIDGVVRWCRTNGCAVPKIVGVDSNPDHVRAARERFATYPSIEIQCADFLDSRLPEADFVVGNPPYVGITHMCEEEKTQLRRKFKTARGRFDLYMLFMERSLDLLGQGGRMCVVTPEKFAYTATAEQLRVLLAQWRVDRLTILPEDTFPGHTTYPMVTELTKRAAGNQSHPTEVIRRDGERLAVRLPTQGNSWMPVLSGCAPDSSTTGPTLSDFCVRVSCGVATGADSIFVFRDQDVPTALRDFSFPTISGRQLRSDVGESYADWRIVVPYTREGVLPPLAELGAYREYVSQPDVEARLRRRTCARRKPWYSFHETPPMQDMLRPKILCKDIAARPTFWSDEAGVVVPRHSVYYIVPNHPEWTKPLRDYLNSEYASSWLAARCQRAANGFLRVQSRLLKSLPVPQDTVDALNAALNGRLPFPVGTPPTTLPAERGAA